MFSVYPDNTLLTLLPFKWWRNIIFAISTTT